VLRGRTVQLAPRHPALGPHGASVRVDLNALHLGQIDHHGVICDREARDVVATTAHADLEAGAAGESDGLGDVIGRSAAHDQRRPPVNHPVVDPAGVLVPGRTGREHPAGQR
jgi:hypothetical protein